MTEAASMISLFNPLMSEEGVATTDWENISSVWRQISQVRSASLELHTGSLLTFYPVLLLL